MLELIAQGSDFDSRWRRQLPSQTVEIGRATQAYRVPWDNQISRRHVKLIPLTGGVRVERIEGAANPVFFNGKEVDDFLLKPGEHFVIGQTSFLLAADKAFVSLNAPSPISQRTFTHEFLQQVPYRNADRRIEVLNRIPEVISSAANVDDLLIRMVNTLMEGITAASTVGIVQLDASSIRIEAGQVNELTVDKEASGDKTFEEASTKELNSNSSSDSIRVIQWDRRGMDGGDFQPSEKLIRQAIEVDETTLHIWHQRRRSPPRSEKYTFDYENDWAFVCPINGEASSGWGIYVAGSNLRGGSTLDTGSGEADLQDDVKFCELVGTTLKNLLLVKQLERQQSSLRSFFSPIVMEAISGRDPDEVLVPRKCDVSVLFCDLRGFSRKSEEMADNLLLLLKRVSDSLGIMTHKILQHGGVIGDFHGDSAMGFWGWPIEPTDPNENAAVAVLAALEIQAAVAAQLAENPKLENFQIGLGIASGNAVAGKIGTSDQVKVTVFGPVVNLASRLEGMSKWFGSCVLTDAETVKRIETKTGSESRTNRRLGKFLPFGMENSLDVFQVAVADSVSINSFGQYESALKAFETGDWVAAKAKLTELNGSSINDPAVDFLLQHMDDRCDDQGEAPADFQGLIRMQVK